MSKALNRSPEISRLTTELVWDKAAEMGYFSRRGLGKRSKLIGVLLPEVRSHYYAELMHTLSREIEREGCIMATILTNQYAQDVQPYLARLPQYDLDGVIVCCDYGFTAQDYRSLAVGLIPAVLITGANAPCFLDTIRIDNDRAMSQALEHLVQLGHKKIGYLGEYHSDPMYRSLCAMLPEYGVELVHSYMKRGKERFEEGGYLRAMELLREKELPTAVIAGYDQIAYGAMRAFAEHGIRVPEDISVIGNSSALPDAFCPMSLTTLMKPVEQMGVAAVQIVKDAMENPKTHVVQNVTLQCSLVVRNSTCGPKQTDSPDNSLI